MEFERGIYDQIDKLVLQQTILMEDFNMLYPRYFVEDQDTLSKQNQLFDIQFRINELYSLLQKSRTRAMGQIIYNERMRQTYTTDARKSLTMKDYVMLTVNPQPAISHTELMTAVKQFMSCSTIEYGYYNIEQRSAESGKYIGFHSHMLFKRRKCPSDVLKDLYRIFDPLCGNRNAIQFKSVDDPKEVCNYIGYMLGAKDDESKLPKVMIDREMRSIFGYQSIYTVGRSPPTCWVTCVADFQNKLQI